MRVSVGRVLVLGCAAALVGVTGACGESGAAAEKPDTALTASASATTPAHAHLDAEVSLHDGRRVGMYYASGRGLMEQHLGRGATAWSTPHLLYRTKSDACQSLTLKAFGDTVTAIANWGVYCSDGEPPTESIAAVGIGNLSKWDTNLTKDFDGWDKVTASSDGKKVSFTNSSVDSVTRLRWSAAHGFFPVEEIPR